MLVRYNMPSSAKERLTVFFGEHGTDLILKHIDDLDSTFGRETAIIIRFVMSDENQEPKRT